jgi:hypothetical protein
MQHGKALKCLRKTISNGQDSIRLALMSSLMFGYFESLHGDWETVTRQVYSAAKVWREANADNGRNKTIQHLTIDSEIQYVKSRIHLQLMSFIAMNSICPQALFEGEEEEHIGEIPHRFATLGEALFYAAKSAMLTLRHWRSCVRHKLFELPDAFPCSTIREQDALIKTTKDWKRSFKPLLRELNVRAVSNEQLGALQFDICIGIFEIIMRTSIEMEEVVFDAFLERFRATVSVSDFMLKKAQELREVDGPRVQFDMGLIMSLFYTATRCRDSSLRREDILLLRQWPSKNGAWGGLRAAKVAEWIVLIEEEGCDEDGFIPEEWRVRMHTLKWIADKERINVECMQGSMVGTLNLRKARLLRF